MPSFKNDIDLADDGFVVTNSPELVHWGIRSKGSRLCLLLSTYLVVGICCYARVSIMMGTASLGTGMAWGPSDARSQRKLHVFSTHIRIRLVFSFDKQVVLG